MDKSKKITIGLYVLSIFLILGISYAYFSLNIIGNDTAKLSVISSGTLELTYSDTNEITLNNAVPGDSFQKEISVKNTGTLDAMYNIIWQELTNEFVRNEIVISATCERLNSEGVIDGNCNNIKEKSVINNIIQKNILIESGITHKYIVTVKFIETGENQNYNQGKNFNGKLGIEESTKIVGILKKDFFEESGMTDRSLVKSISFYSDNRVIDGANSYDVSEEQNGSVKMYVKQNSETNSLYDLSIVANGLIAFPKDSSFLFSFNVNVPCRGPLSNLTLIEFNNSINTSNVTNMSGMFFNISATELDVSSFDTSNVTNMYGMFEQSKALSIIGLENFDTTNVTNMLSMFLGSTNLKTIYASDKFNTATVTLSDGLFDDCTSLVGGSGTAFDSTKTDKTYAKIDGGTSNPGYFTAK